MGRSVEEINERLRKGEAIVLTAQDVRDALREDGSVLKNVDVVTCGTRGLMSGTYAILSFPVSKPGAFERASSASLNGVPAIPGPCPNERLGIVDLMVLGTSVSTKDRRYGAGHLFRDMAEGRESRSRSRRTRATPSQRRSGSKRCVLPSSWPRGTPSATTSPW